MQFFFATTERLDQDDGAILTTICNHSFHCSCISKWADSSCPDGHAIRHWKETQHCFSLELETQRVWDYVGDNYVHRLIQSKTDGKLVELNFHGAHADDTCGSCNCGDSGIDEALFNSKFEAILMEYNDLLTSQLENQRKYFESLLQEAKEEDEREISKAVQKAVNLRLQKLKTKLNKHIEEKRFLEDVLIFGILNQIPWFMLFLHDIALIDHIFFKINENLLKNQETWKAKIQQMEERIVGFEALVDSELNLRQWIKLERSMTVGKPQLYAKQLGNDDYTPNARFFFLSELRTGSGHRLSLT
ncbi:BRCA1-associated protein [Dendrobium catenatum]|uniref:BRCA1-associated protein n=1 Tax=Dendrobium catenatum TaxID=906689 RepID=A0A2I0XBV4_9ASPA|nr:BRCA1-associated protein [Dendrobium catenatum]